MLSDLLGQHECHYRISRASVSVCHSLWAVTPKSYCDEKTANNFEWIQVYVRYRNIRLNSSTIVKRFISKTYISTDTPVNVITETYRVGITPTLD